MYRRTRAEMPTNPIEIREADGHMLKTGPAALTYRGEVDLGALGA